MSGVTLRNCLAEVKRRSAVLYWTGLLHFILGAILAVAMVFDDGVLLGVDRLLKPFKFAVSIGIYTWTFAWFVDYLKNARFGRVLSWIVASTMWLEIVPITMQPLRGTLSHYNTESALGIALFSMMGAAIAVNTVCAALLLGGLIFAGKSLQATYRLGVILGMVVFLMGSGVGGALVGNQAHTVGAPDGGPGLPLVNWSTEAGDLRVAHALGLHAMQVIPLFAFLLIARTGISTRAAGRLVILFSVVYAVAVVLTYLQAAAGRPLIG